ncbi:chromosome segregation protein SMC [Candidatus Cetobacterium colombiensis]|uniref:Chromosome partition protein Smc n=1 Tax=Candidatus Cetobacterium colombiensis TaxID=3073100 RepID=A0ABU4W7X5_9FUSO|nr:chromosome segregation protein SMC [Candidatus Cetobacterium colombiensis]MDX8335285.1 chromosome segregation protein SMC [Candidatus Cetobacterium colombiensis]
MYLKGVEIYGFKSFGERIRIDFDGGITSIVGPNGSGKSNILDGILWVLGEQSYKNIRAKESKDIIFSGGEGKKPANYAEVSLFIDNRDNFFPIEAENIKITRKMSQNGDNDYLINDKKVRLKDIGELFLDTGVGKSAYSVIGQGKVERIISSSNKEIKSIIEEAAGVKKFQQKKLESEKRLEKVQNELEKIELVLSEIGENRTRVEKQSKKAIEYLAIKDEKNLLQKGVLTFDLNSKEEILNSGEKEQERLVSITSSLEEELKKSELDLNEIENRRKELYEKIENFSESNVQLKSEIETLEKEEIRTRERITSYSREFKQKEEEAVSLEKILESKKEIIEKLKEEKERVQERVIDIEGKNREFEKNIEEQENSKKDKEISIELKKRKIMDLEVEKLKLLNEIESSTRRMKGSEFKITSLKEEKEGFHKKIDENRQELEKALKNRDLKLKELKETEERQIQLEQEISSLSKDMNKAAELIRNAEFEEKRASARLQGLYRVQESNEGFYKGVKEVLNAKIPGVEGAVISLITVPEEYQKAIEAAIPGNLQDIVVTTSLVAKKGIEVLKEKKAGRASFLALDTIKVGSIKEIPKKDGVIGRASDLVSSDGKYKKILDMLLGNILVVKETDIALKILKENGYSGNIVTLSGELLSSRGRITGGENSNSIVSQIFERKKEIKSLEENLKETSSKLKEWNEKVHLMNGKLEKYEDEIAGIDSLEDSLRKQSKLAEELYLDLKSRAEKLEKEKRVVDIEIKEEENYSREYAKRVENSQGEKEIAEKMVEELKNELDKENLLIQSLNESINALKNQFSDIRILYLNSKDRFIQIEKEEEKERINQSEIIEKKEKISNILLEIKKELEKLEEKAHTIADEIKNKNIKFENENQELKEMKKEDHSLEEKSKELIKSSREIESTLFKEKEILNRELERKERISKEIQEILLQLEELLEVETYLLNEEDIKVSRTKVRELELKLRGFESVNLLSIEEFKELDNKYKFIDLQREDLVKGEKSLSLLIKEIDETIEEKFYEAYEEINKNFNEMCIETLDNSEGKLSLHNGEDFVNCGVEISVKYKNKKRQALSLLSGGEKSMVAIAFIMAIFMYKPSPFTFLDEIEAALDEKNTRKLIGKLKEFTDRSQFILITHNKETMKASDSLYGVTMNKKIGISKLVQVKI